MTAGYSAQQTERVIPPRGMRIEAIIFLALCGFFVIAAIVYGIFAGAAEPVGVTALWLTAGLALITGSFLMFSSRRLDHARPEDDEDADIADGAGDMGFFAPGSYWPFAMALSAAVTAVATAFLLWWLMIIAGGFLLTAISGLLFEFHRSHSAH